MSIEQEIEKLIAESEKFEAVTVADPVVETIDESEVEAKKLAEAAELEATEAQAKLDEEQAIAVKAAMAADVAALVEGEDLTEEFKVKAATIFEAAVLSRVKAEVAKLDEQYTEAFEVQLEEAVATEVEGLIEQVDGYLTYMAEQWMNDNEIALERGLKSEILEGFVSGLKGLFEEHYIDVPENATDIVAEMESVVSEKEAALEEMTTKLNESEQRNIELNKTLAGKTRADLIEAKVAGLADTDAEKFKDLAEELSFDNAETFNKKLQVIRENYFDKKVSAPASQTFLTEGSAVVEEKIVSANMNAYMSALSNSH